MKKLVNVVEVENEGLMSFMGERIFIVAQSYFYEGVLSGVNNTCVLLEDAYFVLESGDFTKNTITNAEKICNGKLYVQCSSIESFFKSHRK
jgi:hypothetical protein